MYILNWRFPQYMLDLSKNETGASLVLTRPGTLS